MNRLGQRYPESIEFDLDPVRLAQLILTGALLLECGFVIADLVSHFDLIRLSGDSGNLLDMGRQNSIAAGFARTQNLLTGLTCGLLALVVRHNSGVTREVIGWLTVGVFFAVRAVGPGILAGENTRWPVFEADGIDLLASFSGMQMVLALCYALLGLFSLAFLWNTLEEPRARIHLGAAIGCIILAAALTLLAALPAEHPWNILVRIGDLAGPLLPQEWIRQETPPSIRQRYSRLSAMSLEMAATTLIWCLGIRYFAATVSSLRLRFTVH